MTFEHSPGDYLVIRRLPRTSDASEILGRRGRRRLLLLLQPVELFHDQEMISPRLTSSGRSW
jgi:hypothetical protein